MRQWEYATRRGKEIRPRNFIFNAAKGNLYLWGRWFQKPSEQLKQKWLLMAKVGYPVWDSQWDDDDAEG